MEKQTAVEWFAGAVLDCITTAGFEILLRKAKEMEKEQIIEAHESGVGSIDYGYGIEYYNETYGKD